MNVTAQRLRSVGWIALLLLCGALVMVLAFRVNALRSQVHQSDLRIIALRQETMYLETEFETRANQQQLKAWNDVDFGYVAPSANQYIDGERQLAAYARPSEPGAPAPIRVASADDSVAAAAAFPAMVHGEKPAAKADSATDDSVTEAAPGRVMAKVPTGGVAAPVALALGDRLAHVRHGADDASPKQARLAKATVQPEPAAHKAKDSSGKTAAAGKAVSRAGDHDKLASGAHGGQKSAESKVAGKKVAAVKIAGKNAGRDAAKAPAHKTVPTHAALAHAAKPHDTAPNHRDAHHGEGGTIRLALKDVKTHK